METFQAQHFLLILKKLWPNLRPHARRFGIAFALILVSTGIEVLLPFVVGKSVDAAIDTAHNFKLLANWCFFYLGLVFVKSLLEGVQAYEIQGTGQVVMHELRQAIFWRIQNLPVAYFDKNPTGRLLTRVVNDIKSLAELFTAALSVLALDLMIIAGTIITMFWMDWRLSAATLFSFPIVLITIKVFGEKQAIAYREVRLRLAEINAFLGENLAGLATIQRLCAQKMRGDRFSTIVNQHNDAQMASVQQFALIQPITNAINGLSMGILILLGGYWVIEGKISLGLLVAFFGYLRNLFQPVRDLVEKYNTLLSAAISAERIVGILEEDDEYQVKNGELITQVGKHSIEFNDVSFSYPGRKQTALESVSFQVPEGSSLAIVGATGSGKSTLIRLLLRFYEPTSGEISFGGHQLTLWDKHALRRQLAVVHQEIYLFRGSLRENLLLNQTGFDDAFLIEQTKRAQLWDFVKGRGGLDFHVQEGGTNLSLGEKQLVSFARILILNPPVLVFDEATSNIDNVMERRLIEAVHEVTRGRTTIIIAHRLSTIQQCDSIIVMERGRKVETGTFSHLIRAGGPFQKFHEIFLGEDAISG